MFGILRRLLGLFFKESGEARIGIYGPPNGGKTTLANRICKDWLGEEMGTVSKIAHETREVRVKERVTIKRGLKSLTVSLIDTPGITTKVDYEEFMRGGLAEPEAKARAKEATRGVIDAIRWLDDVELVIVVLDATLDPYTQVNITIIGNLEARKVPVFIVANKTDLKKVDVKHVQSAFPQYEVVGISAKTGEGLDRFYEKLFELKRRIKRRPRK